MVLWVSLLRCDTAEDNIVEKAHGECFGFERTTDHIRDPTLDHSFCSLVMTHQLQEIVE